MVIETYHLCTVHIFIPTIHSALQSLSGERFFYLKNAAWLGGILSFLISAAANRSFGPCCGGYRTFGSRCPA